MFSIFIILSLVDEDEMLARSLEKEQEVLMKSQEQKEFKRLQSIHGFDQTKNLSRQRDANLLRSAERGNLSAVEYHEKRIMLNILEKNGIDDGSSVSHGEVVMNNTQFLHA